MTEDNHDTLIAAVRDASAKWIAAFNAGDADGCTAAYEKDAVMNAEPFGTFTGHKQIHAFWTKLIESGFTGIEYVDPKIEIVDPQSAILSSDWRMNNAQGVITKELWVLQPDGTVLLREDDFEALG